MIEERAPRLAAAITWIVTTLFFVVALVLAVVIPIHAQDALTFGEWSRLIAQHWHLHYAAATAQEYGRPLFYVLQGWLWGVLGFGEPSGRVLSLLFSLLFFGSVVWLVRAERDWARLAGLLAAVAVLAIPVFAVNVSSGLTDIPVAALVALAGALVWQRRPGPPRAVGIAIVAALAMLAKPSALLALVGLAIAQLPLNESWRGRLVYRIGPLAAGIGLGLVYDETQARDAHQNLRTFLQAGVNTDYYRTLADEARRYALLDAGWFGDGLRVAILFALVYTVLRLVDVGHRLCVAVGAPLALLGSWLGPWIAAREGGVTVGSLHSAGAAATAVGTALFLSGGVLSFREAIPDRGELFRFALWVLPTAVAWAVYGAYDFRLLAPGWPPLLALLVLAALPAGSALARRGAPLLALPFALFAIVIATNVYNLDGLQKSGWRQLRATDDWLDRDATREIVLPALSRALVVVRRQMRPGDDLVSPEGAFRFYFPGHVEQSYPNNCEFLHRFRVFVLTTDEGSKRYMKDFLHVSPEPSFWAACKMPRLTQLTSGADGYAVFRIER
jgi:hypothetical protein